ncbi:hypothetical protein Bca52824_078146 [Brassica carinata]|uniref:Small ribosomal subunit protein uS5 C-terminal domain-containing protein n=1 Tax=Brassica carinata TaxID=52824 RepID=A0A8X7PY51_BRACI|nr:hypothetical protein Bca52824_078146 [Brassica carinata]
MKLTIGFVKGIISSVQSTYLCFSLLSSSPVRRGYWGNKIGKPHTVPCKVTGKCGSVTVRMVPAPRGAGIVAARVPKMVLQFNGIDDVFISSRGSTKTLETSPRWAGQALFGTDAAKWICVSAIDVTQLSVAVYLVIKIYT